MIEQVTERPPAQHDVETAGPAPRPRPPEHVTGAKSLIRSLEEVGAEVVFGIPGGAILPAY
ncbi:hypothetical protein, partial [Streptomyces sp. WM6378]